MLINKLIVVVWKCWDTLWQKSLNFTNFELPQIIKWLLVNYISTLHHLIIKIHEHYQFIFMLPPTSTFMCEHSLRWLNMTTCCAHNWLNSTLIWFYNIYILCESHIIIWLWLSTLYMKMVNWLYFLFFVWL